MRGLLDKTLEEAILDSPAGRLLYAEQTSEDFPERRFEPVRVAMNGLCWDNCHEGKETYCRIP
jgi:hypothetical protein